MAPQFRLIFGAPFVSTWTDAVREEWLAVLDAYEVKDLDTAASYVSPLVVVLPVKEIFKP